MLLMQHSSGTRYDKMKKIKEKKKKRKKENRGIEIEEEEL